MDFIFTVILFGLLAVLAAFGLYQLVKWAKGMPKGAYLFLAFFPLISLFPIPPTVFKNVEKAKQEQRKRKPGSGGKKKP